MTEISAWLDGAAVRVFVLCATLFVAMNGVAIAMVVLKRDRGLVNRWTARWLAANFLLLGAGLGVPMVAKVVHVTVDAFSASRSLKPPIEQDGEEPAPARPR